MERIRRSQKEWEEVFAKVDDMVSHGMEERTACQYLGVNYDSCRLARARISGLNAIKNSEFSSKESANLSAQLDGIAYGLESVTLKLEKLIDIGNAILDALDVKKPAAPTNNFGKAEKEAVERELGITRFKDVHHI